jgi:hypothetical protein
MEKRIVSPVKSGVVDQLHGDTANRSPYSRHSEGGCRMEWTFKVGEVVDC